MGTHLPAAVENIATQVPANAADGAAQAAVGQLDLCEVSIEIATFATRFAHEDWIREPFQIGDEFGGGRVSAPPYQHVQFAVRNTGVGDDGAQNLRVQARGPAD